MFALLAVIAFAITAGCLWFFFSQRDAAYRQAARELEAIAGIKGWQLTQWRDERMREGRELFTRQILMHEIADFLASGSAEPPESLRTDLKVIRESNTLVDLLLVRPSGVVAYSSSGRDHVEQEEAESLRMAISTRTVVCSGFVFTEGDNKPHLALMIPVVGQAGGVDGALMMCIDDTQENFPLNPGWPVPSDSGKFLLYRDDAGSMQFLFSSSTQDMPDSGAPAPRDAVRLPAMQALRGETGVVSGLDCRGNEVLAALHPVPDTSWLLTAEIDRDEILAGWNDQAVLIMLLLAALLCLPVMGMVLAQGEARRRHLEARIQAEAEAARLSRLFNMLSHTNQLVVRTRDADALLEGACRIAVELGGFQFAWAGLVDDAGVLRPAARAGKDFGFVDTITSPLHNGSGEAPVQVSADASVNNDLEAAAAGRPWSAAAQRAGIAASACVPLQKKGSVIGALCFYAEQRGYFGEGEIAALKEMAGDVSYALEHLDELEQREAAERALNESREQLQQAVSAGNIGLWNWDPVNDHFVVSPEWRRQLGLEYEQLTGTIRDFFDRLHPDEAPRVEEQRAILRASRRKSFNFEFRLRHADGSYRWILSLMSLRRDASGATERVLGANVDITERKILEQEILQSQKMESIGRLAGGVAHDFNNILSVISGYAELGLERLDKDAPVAADLLEIKSASDRAANLTQQLLAFSRRQAIRQEVVDLNQVVRESQKMLERLIGEDIELSAALDPDLPAVMADPGQIGQVLINLAVNARDAMPKGGKLQITTWSETPARRLTAPESGIKHPVFSCISITDSGTGMNSEQLERVFDPFYTTKSKGHGTGLGLATVYAIVTQSKGSVSVSSEPGNGTTFTIMLPAQEAVAKPAEPPQECAEDRPGGSERVLLVEDEAFMRDVTERMLVKLGYNVVSAVDGEDALEKLTKADGGFDLMLSDVIMPRLNGAELAARVRESWPGLRILLMSGYTDDIIGRHGVLEEGIQLLNKPFKLNELAEKLRAVLSKPPVNA